MLRRVALVRTDVSEEPSAGFIRVTIICELGTTQALNINRRTLRRNTKEALGSSETSVLPRATRRESLKSYMISECLLKLEFNVSVPVIHIGL
jgi:hypothetical protein